MSDQERETAYLCYSSGTTGRAKGVETSHHNMTSQVQALHNAYQPLRGRDAVLGVLPFGHIYGLTFLLHQPLTVQATVVVLPRFDALEVLTTIAKVNTKIKNTADVSVQDHMGSHGPSNACVTPQLSSL